MLRSHLDIIQAQKIPCFNVYFNVNVTQFVLFFKFSQRHRDNQVADMSVNVRSYCCGDLSSFET